MACLFQRSCVWPHSLPLLPSQREPAASTLPPPHLSSSYGSTDPLSGNEIQVIDESAGLDYVFGAYSTGTNPVIASDNRVTVKNSTLKAIFGAQTNITADSENADAEASNNRVDVLEITISDSDASGLFGSFIDIQTTSGEISARAENNTLIVTNSEINAYICGNETYAVSDSGNSTVVANSNTVTVSNSTIDGDVMGSSSYASSGSAKAIAEASNNRVNVFGDVSGDIYGGSSEAEGRKAFSAADNNQITLTDSDVSSGIFGGESRIHLANESAAVTANGNGVTISASEISDFIYGGFIYSSAACEVSAEARDNTLTILDNSIINSDAYGGYSEIRSGNGSTAATLSGNTISVSGSNTEVSGELYGSYAEITSSTGNISAAINSNTVIVEDSVLWSYMTHGGYAEISSSSGTITAEANGNTVNILTAAEGDIYGGHTEIFSSDGNLTASANNNRVTASGDAPAEWISIWGGEAQIASPAGGEANANASGNHITVSDGFSAAGFLYGGHARSVSDGGTAIAEASGNTVEVSGDATEVSNDIYGGHAEANSDGGHAVAVADNNHVIVSDGATIGRSIHGGYVNDTYSDTESFTASASRNTVTINGATIEDRTIIAGGAIGDDNRSNGTYAATNNTVNITVDGSHSIQGVYLYGGYALRLTPGSNVDIFSGNTLNLNAREVAQVAVSTVENFETINIQAGNVSNGDVVLNADRAILGNGADKGTTVNFISIDNASLAAGDTLTLISNVEGTLANDGEERFVRQGTSFSLGYDTVIRQEGNAVTARIRGSQANPETKVLSENRTAGLAFVNTGTDLLIDTNITDSFGAIRGGHTRYNTGSSVEVDGVNLIAGASTTFMGESRNITAGVFIEGGWGDTTTHNTIGGRKLKGEGDSHYYGAGLLGRLEQTQGTLRGAYADASLRVGRLSSDYTNNDVAVSSGQSLNCDMDATYFAAHVGLGYQWNLTDNLRADTSIRYMWSHVEAKTVQTAGDTYKFDAMNSHRVRAGVRFDYLADAPYTPYIGVEWEHEFNGKAKGSVQHINLESADLGGSSGVVNLGVEFKPEANTPLTVDAGFVGYFGQHKGIAGQIRMKYAF